MAPDSMFICSLTSGSIRLMSMVWLLRSFVTGAGGDNGSRPTPAILGKALS